MLPLPPAAIGPPDSCSLIASTPLIWPMSVPVPWPTQVIAATPDRPDTLIPAVLLEHERGQRIGAGREGEGAAVGLVGAVRASSRWSSPAPGRRCVIASGGGVEVAFLQLQRQLTAAGGIVAVDHRDRLRRLVGVAVAVGDAVIEAALDGLTWLLAGSNVQPPSALNV